MITLRALNYLATGLRSTAPMVRDYTPSTALHMHVAALQWRKDVESVASMLDLAQERSGNKRKTYDKARFLKACGVDEHT